MDRFHVLPSSPDFQNLTNEQLEWIIYSAQLDNKKKGPESYEDYDDSWFEAEEFEPLREGDDEEEIARQVEKLTSEEDKARLEARLEDTAESEEIAQRGEKSLEEESIDNLIAENIRKAQEEARRLESHKGTQKTAEQRKQEKENATYQAELDTGSIQDAVALFEGDQEDDFEI